MLELEYPKYSNKKIEKEINFDKSYLKEILINNRISTIMKIKTSSFYQFFERFLNNPKSEIKRYRLLYKYSLKKVFV